MGIWRKASSLDDSKFKKRVMESEKVKKKKEEEEGTIDIWDLNNSEISEGNIYL